jgi:hypothetical protein
MDGPGNGELADCVQRLADHAARTAEFVDDARSATRTTSRCPRAARRAAHDRIRRTAITHGTWVWFLRHLPTHELADETQLDAGQSAGGWDDVEFVNGPNDRVRGSCSPREHIDEIDAVRLPLAPRRRFGGRHHSLPTRTAERFRSRGPGGGATIR